MILIQTLKGWTALIATIESELGSGKHGPKTSVSLISAQRWLHKAVDMLWWAKRFSQENERKTQGNPSQTPK